MRVKRADLWNVDFRFPQLLAPLPAPVVSLHTPPPPFSATFLSVSHTQKQEHEHKRAGLQATLLSTAIEAQLEITWSNPSFYRGGTEAQRGAGPFPRSHSKSGAGPETELHYLSCALHALPPLALFSLQLNPSPCPIPRGRRGLKGMDIRGSGYPWGSLMVYPHGALPPSGLFLCPHERPLSAEVTPVGPGAEKLGRLPGQMHLSQHRWDS